MDLTLDKDFEAYNGLKWYPFIGDEYRSGSPSSKILLVNEMLHSHAPDRRISSKDSLRFWISDQITSGRERLPHLLTRTCNTLLGSNEIDQEKFWRSVAFHNLLQRPLATSGEKLSAADYISGWNILAKLIEDLRPAACIILSSQAQRVLLHLHNQIDLILINYARSPKIKGVYPAAINAITKDGIESKLTFVTNPFLLYYYPSWNKYLTTVIPTPISYLRNKLA